MVALNLGRRGGLPLHEQMAGIKLNHYRPILLFDSYSPNDYG